MANDIVRAGATQAAEQVPAKPSTQEFLTPEVLFLNQFTTYRLAEAFAGQTNPTTIWRSMVHGDPLAMLYYRELEEKDADVGEAIAEMKLSVLSRNMTVVPGDDSQAALDARDFIEAQLNGLPDLRNALDAILDAPFYGYSVGEQIFDVSSGQVALVDVRDCPQELFAFAPIVYPQIGQLRMKQVVGDYDGVLMPEDKFVVFSSRMRSRNRLGRPLLRAVFWPSWFKRQTERLWLRFAERGPGTAVVKYSRGATEDEKKQALTAAEALITQVAMAVPENFEVMQDLLQAARSQDPATYKTMAERMESQIYRRVVGSTLTSHGSDGGKGTQALGNVHAETKEDRSREMTTQLQSVLNRQLVRNLHLWNFGPNIAMPKVQFDISDEEDLGARITVDDTLQSMGLTIPAQYARDRYGVPKPDEGEETLQRAQAPIAISTPAGPPDHPQFSAGSDAADKEMAQYDHVFGGLRGSALSAFAGRVREIAGGMTAADLKEQ